MRSRRLVRALQVLGLLLVLLLAGLAGARAWFDARVVPELDARIEGLRSFRPLTTCRVQDKDGALIDEFYVERRIWLPWEEMAPVAWQAVIAAEDRRFFEHPGVDLWGIARAMVVNVLAGDIREGGSTITQQVVKNLVVGNERSYERKLIEALLAWRLEKQLGKDEILELYVNLVYLGAGNYGLEAAAQDYFGLSAQELDAGQAALLAGLIPAPSRYSPRRDPAAARVRRGLVLQAMVEEGYITAEQARSFGEGPVDPPRRAGRGGDTGTAYVTAVRREVRRLLGTELPVRHGLVVRTAYDPALQAVAEQAIEDAARAVQERQGLAGPIRSLAPGEVEPFLAAAQGLARDPETGAPALPAAGSCFPVVLGSGPRQPVRAGSFSLLLPAAEWKRKVRSRDPEQAGRSLSETRPTNQVWSVCTDGEGELVLQDEPWVQGAAVIVENATGRVVALTGGRGMELEGFLRATQARRQPGSSFKPYVYAAALRAGRSSQDIVVDGPISLPAGGGKTWSPGNYDGGYAGSVTLATAFAKSLNTVAVRLAMETGPEAIVQLARDLGVQTPLRSDLTVALGTSEVTPMDQATAMAGIARMGVTAEAHLLLEIHDTLGNREGVAGGPVVIDGKAVAFLPGGPGRRVLPGGTAAALVELMRGVVEQGTARKARRPDQVRIGKTGTASDFVDAWFVGATPTHSVAVWIGTDGMTSLGPSETGGRAALPAFMAIADALPVGPELAFGLPDDAILLPTAKGPLLSSRSAPPAALRPVVPDPAPLPPFPQATPPLQVPAVIH